MFEKRKGWFRHELIQKCFEDSLNDERRQKYHKLAAAHYLSKIQNIREPESIGLYFDNASYYAYHISKSNSNYPESYHINHKLAIQSSILGNLDFAERYFKRALLAAREMKNTRYEMAVLSNMTASVYMVWGRFNEALNNYFIVLKYYNETNNESKAADILIEIGKIYNLQGNDKALEYYQKSLEIKEELSNKEGISNTLNNIGIIFEYKEEHDKALEYYQKSLEIDREIRNSKGIALTLENMAIIFAKKGDINKADTTLKESLNIHESMGNRYGIAGTYNNLGNLYYNNKYVEKALEYFVKSLEAYTELNDEENVSILLGKIDTISKIERS